MLVNDEVNLTENQIITKWHYMEIWFIKNIIIIWTISILYKNRTWKCRKQYPLEFKRKSWFIIGAVNVSILEIDTKPDKRLGRHMISGQ